MGYENIICLSVSDERFSHKKKKKESFFFKKPKTAQSFILSLIKKNPVDNKVKSYEWLE